MHRIFYSFTGTIKKWFVDDKEGWIDLTLTRVHMVGPAGSGKTCSQNLLLNEPPPQHSESVPRTTSTDLVNPRTSSETSRSFDPRASSDTSMTSTPSSSHVDTYTCTSFDSTAGVHHSTTTSPPNSSSNSITDSTPIACKTVKALRIASDNDEAWKRITRDELLERLASRLKRAAAKFSQQKQVTSAPPPSTKSSVEKVTQEAPEESEAPEEPRDHGAVVKEIIDLIHTAKSQLSEKWAYIIDSGGQPAFQELLPVFTRAASLNVITLDLSKGLDEEFEYMYRINGKEFKCDEKMKYSNRKVFNSVVSAASVQKPLDIPYLIKPSQKTIPIHSMSFVLGTHYDVMIGNSEDEKEAEAEVKQMSDELMSQLDSHSKEHIIQNIYEDSIIFPVDTLIKDPEKRKKISQKFLKKISGCNETSLTVRLPIWLFVFELCLDKKAKTKGGFVTKEEADDEGKRLDMTPSDVDDALKYLHECTIILYYPDIEPRLVFVDPLKILDVLSQLLALTYVDEDTAKTFAPKITQKEMTALKDRGCFKEDLFYDNAVFTGEFQPKYFINLLKECHIIAELQEKNSQPGDKAGDVKYFFPSALRSYDGSFGGSPTDRKPLLYVWRKQKEVDEEKVFVNVPQGIFPLMIVRLLKQEECVVKLSNPDGASQFRDAVSLLVSFDKNDNDPDEHLYIINCKKHIEVIFTGEKEQCPKINTLVQKVINSSANYINISVEDLNVAFACQRDSNKYCIVKNEVARKTVCRSKLTHTCTLDDSYWCWFTTSGMYTDFMFCTSVSLRLFYLYFKGSAQQHAFDRKGSGSPQCKRRRVEEIDGKCMTESSGSPQKAKGMLLNWPIQIFFSF